MRYYEQQMQQQALALHTRVASDRNPWMDKIKHEPGAKLEQIGNSQVLRDGQGKVRDVEYKSGDVRFRSFEYDQNGQVRQMIVDSKSKGVQIWTPGQDGAWHNVAVNRGGQGQAFRGSMSVDQESASFTYNDGRGARTFTTDGRWENGGARRQERPTPVRPDQSRDGVPKGTDLPALPQIPRNEAVDKAYTQFFGVHNITDRTNYKDNLWDAAATKKPVCMTFYRSGEPGAADLLKKLADAKDKSGNKVEFMAVDLDKVDPNSPIGKYARDYIGRNRESFGTPMTVLFTQSQDTRPGTRTPVLPDKPLHYQRGANLDVDKLVSNATKAVDIQNQRDIKVPHRDGHPDGPDSPLRPDGGRKGPTPEQLLSEIQKEASRADGKFDIERLHNLMVVPGPDGKPVPMDAEDKMSLLRDATRMIERPADQLFAQIQTMEKAKAANAPIDEKALAAAKQQLQGLAIMDERAHQLVGRELLPVVMNNQKFDVAELKSVFGPIDKDGFSVKERFNFMGDAVRAADMLKAANPQGMDVDYVVGKARSMMGLLSADLGKEYQARIAAEKDPKRQKDLTKDMYDSQIDGLCWIMSAGKADKRIYSDPGYEPLRQVIEKSGVFAGAAGKLILDKGKVEPDWANKEAGANKAVADALGVPPEIRAWKHSIKGDTGVRPVVPPTPAPPKPGADAQPQTPAPPKPGADAQPPTPAPPKPGADAKKPTPAPPKPGADAKKPTPAPPKPGADAQPPTPAPPKPGGDAKKPGEEEDSEGWYDWN